ncbi:thioredoxin family protein [uncultured Bilophila sp.]|uniref:thioredoxin family protein n=1 Tax=uncultured Bilophila sp. TaxID=529385 RepID=UPI00280B158E|nr:thioredoxin family protein [uncultured Bilophila sp.]
MLIKILGPGCVKCEEAQRVVSAAVLESGNFATVEKVKDFKEMLVLGVMSTPAVAIDGTVMCTGRIPSKQEVMEWMATIETTPGD